MKTGMTSISLRAVAALAAFAVLAFLAPVAAANGRVALLIGNNAYPSSPLRNAVNDSRDLGAALRELGFKTIVKENTSRAEMIAALQEFGKALDGAEAALFFYAGHAMQFKDRNYLIPIDAVMGSEDDVTFFSVEVAQVFDRMERARTRFNFVILDACRDNPFRDTFKVERHGPRADERPVGHAHRLRDGAGRDGGGRIRPERHLHGAPPAEHQGARHARGGPIPQGARGRRARHQAPADSLGAFVDQG